MLPGISPLMMVSAGGGTTPNAVAWDDIDGTGLGSGSNTAKRISGLSEPVVFRAIISAVSKSPPTAMGFLYVANNGAVVSTVSALNSLYADFTVSTDDEVLYTAGGESEVSWSYGFTVTVKYKSPGSSTFDQTLDTFDVALSGAGSGGGGI